ncbi:unnamed protein product [Cochlearia groenlandica]
MPSSPSRSITRCLKVSNFVPKSWKQSQRLIPETPNTHNEPIPDTLYESLQHFISHGYLREAFRTFSLLLLRHQCSSTSSHWFVLHSSASLLSTCVVSNEFDAGQQIHAHCISSGNEFDPGLVRKLVTFYSGFNLLDEAKTITESSNDLHPLPWTVLIDSYVRKHRFQEAIDVYKRMVSKGIRPDDFTYPSVLKACGALLDFASGRVVHGSIEVSSHRCSLFVRNTLISMYSRFGKVGIARKLFDKMPERDAISWNAIINCYASKGKLEEAIDLSHTMNLSGVEMTAVTWNTIAGGCFQCGNYVGALNVVANMMNNNVSLDDVAMIIGLKACSEIGALQWGKVFHCLAISSGYTRIDNFQNSLITMYSRCGALRDTFIVFEEIETNSLSTWNSIISGFAYNERPEETTFMLKEMLLAGFHPNYVTLASILPLCARVANLQYGKESHCYIMRRQSFRDCLILWNSLVDMYAKSGEIVAAKRVFDSMSKRDKVTYTSLINGYGMVGEGKAALACFNSMLRSGIKPDHVTMVAILSACSHSGLASEGQRQFLMMKNVYDIQPRLEHYSCMVDLFCRAGHLAKARDIIKITHKPSSAMCATLLIACLVHENKDIGEWAADKLRLEAKPKSLGHYLLLADMYRMTSSWSNLAETVRMAREFAMVETGSVGSNKPMVETVGSSSINEEQSSDEERLVETG